MKNGKIILFSGIGLAVIIAIYLYLKHKKAVSGGTAAQIKANTAAHNADPLAYLRGANVINMQGNTLSGKPMAQSQDSSKLIIVNQIGTEPAPAPSLPSAPDPLLLENAYTIWTAMLINELKTNGGSVVQADAFYATYTSILPATSILSASMQLTVNVRSMRMLYLQVAKAVTKQAILYIKSNDGGLMGGLHQQAMNYYYQQCRNGAGAPNSIAKLMGVLSGSDFDQQNIVWSNENNMFGIYYFMPGDGQYIIAPSTELVTFYRYSKKGKWPPDGVASADDSNQTANDVKTVISIIGLIAAFA